MDGETCAEGHCFKLCVYFSLVADWQAHRNAIFDVDWMPGENQLITAGGDQNLALWDVSAETSIASFHGHTSSIKSVSFVPTHNGQSHVIEMCICVVVTSIHEHICLTVGSRHAS